eukprot:746943-Hanusia_phi.AAC.2
MSRQGDAGIILPLPSSRLPSSSSQQQPVAPDSVMRLADPSTTCSTLAFLISSSAFLFASFA